VPPSGGALPWKHGADPPVSLSCVVPVVRTYRSHMHTLTHTSAMCGHQSRGRRRPRARPRRLPFGSMFLCLSDSGLVHAWVGQILLNCDIFKRLFVRPTERRSEGHEWQLAEATADLS
jgi:hypothetical protein